MGIEDCVNVCANNENEVYLLLLAQRDENAVLLVLVSIILFFILANFAMGLKIEMQGQEGLIREITKELALIKKSLETEREEH